MECEATMNLIAMLLLCVWASTERIQIPKAGEPISVVLPDYASDVYAFDTPEREVTSWWPHAVNAAWGGGSGGTERKGGWIDQHWMLVDYLDRSQDYASHEYLRHRGIWHDVSGSNEYQETIGFHEEGTKKLLWDNGVARDMYSKRVLSEQYNTSVPWWADQIGWNAYIVCNNAPRWSSIINYDWLTSPLMGYSISQDNIGAPTIRNGAGGHGRFCDYCNMKFFHYLRVNGRLTQFRQQYGHINDYVQNHLMDVVQKLPPYTMDKFDVHEAELLAALCAAPVMSEYQKFLYLSHLSNFVRYYRDVKLIAERVGRDYDVHGNQGGGFIGVNPYQIVLSEFVDRVWLESSGLSSYYIFQHDRNNASRKHW